MKKAKNYVRLLNIDKNKIHSLSQIAKVILLNEFRGGVSSDGTLSHFKPSSKKHV